MNTLPTECLSHEALELFAASTSGQKDAERAHEHLAACVRCRAALAEIRSNNELLTAVLPTNRAGLKSSLAAPDHLTIPGYTLGTEVHRGAQGVVYQAAQLSTRRNVAIKIMRGTILADQAARMRFEREVHILAQLRHPHIVTIHDSGTTAGLSYIVMDFVDGPALDDHVAQRAAAVKRPGPETRELLALFAQIAEAVNAAHVKGVIHRDLKPSNIRVDASGQPRILDFGLARLSDEAGGPGDLTITGQFIGSLPYASPEQAEGTPERIDTRSDVYALGVTMYQLLVGRFPYDVTGKLPDALDTIRRAAPAPMRRSGSATEVSAARRAPWLIDDDIETIVMKCLSKEPQRRYQTAGELARDIRHYLANEPIEAKRDSAGYMLRKTLSRHRVAAAVSMLFLVVVTGSAVLLGVLYRRQLVETKRADANASQALAEASKQEAINAFLQRLLGAANLEANPEGREATVRQALDKAAAEVDAGSLEGQPEVEAAVRETLGRAYLTMNEVAAADKHLSASLALRESLFGRRSGPVAETLCPLGELRMDQGKFKEAEPYLREALDIFDAVYGRQSPYAARALNDLGVLLRELSRLDEAEPMLREALELRRQFLASDSDGLALTLHNLASLVNSRGEFIEAEALYLQALELRQTDNARRIHTLSNLAIVQGKLDKLPEAEQKLREALAIAQRVFGQEHPSVATRMHNLAMALWLQDKLDEAKPLFEDSLAMRRKLLGDDHRTLSSSLLGLGGVLQDQGRFAEAEALMREAVAVTEKAHGPRHASILVDRNLLGMVLYDQERLAEAENIYREIIQIHREELGTSHPQYGTFLDNFSQVLVRQGNLAEAEKVSRESLEVRRAGLPPPHRQITLSMIHLGEILLLQDDSSLEAEAGELLRDSRDRHHQSSDAEWRIAETDALYGSYLAATGQFAEAEPLLLAGYAAVKDRPQLPERERDEALTRLVQFYETWENAEPGNGYAAQAAEWREQLDALGTTNPQAAQREGS